MSRMSFPIPLKLQSAHSYVFFKSTINKPSLRHASVTEVGNHSRIRKVTHTQQWGRV